MQMVYQYKGCRMIKKIKQTNTT